MSSNILSSARNLWRELQELQTSSPDLRDVRRDFGFSLCAAPLSDSCPKISERGDWRLEIGDWRLEIGDWRLEIGDWKIRVSIGVVLGVEPRGQVIEVRTYLIFELKYLHDMSEVFILSIGINKR